MKKILFVSFALMLTASAFAKQSWPMGSWPVFSWPNQALETENLAGLIAYNLLPKKLSVNIEIIDKSWLVA